MQIILNPPQGWVRHLSDGCYVWLTKEQEVATVVAPFTPPMGRQRTGRLFIRRNYDGPIDYWFVSADGKGIDGSTIMEPLEGSLPESPVELQSSEAQELRLEIQRLWAAVAELQASPQRDPLAGLRVLLV